VNDSELVISFLFDNAAVERVYLGSNGLLSGSVEGRLFIDMSTVSPGTHERIAPEMTSRNGRFIECPVSGSIPTARSGALVGFAGGDAAAFARPEPLLRQLCRRVEHVGTQLPRGLDPFARAGEGVFPVATTSRRSPSEPA
jgi:3-hydroxyisobutyrate dehydrogenase